MSWSYSATNVNSADQSALDTATANFEAEQTGSVSQATAATTAAKALVSALPAGDYNVSVSGYTGCVSVSVSVVAPPAS